MEEEEKNMPFDYQTVGKNVEVLTSMYGYNQKMIFQQQNHVHQELENFYAYNFPQYRNDNPFQPSFSYNNFTVNYGNKELITDSLKIFCYNEDENNCSTRKGSTSGSEELSRDEEEDLNIELREQMPFISKWLSHDEDEE